MRSHHSGPPWPSERASALRELSIEHVAKAAGNDPEVLRLENLDTDLLPPAAAIAATEEALRCRRGNSYLPFEGSVTLREAVAARLRRQSGIDYSPDEVVVTCGGTEGLFDAVLATTDPGDQVIVTDPTYAGIMNRIALAGVRAVPVPFVSDGGELHLDADALRAAIGPRMRTLLLMNPSMPSGAYVSHAEWEVVRDLCVEAPLWLIYDAAMERILFDGKAYLHPARLDGLASRTITVGSVSKEFRMIGWRIGWIVAPLSIAGAIRLVHTSNAVTPSGFAQAGAVAALQASDDDFERCRQEWERRRDLVFEQTAGFSRIRPAGGWSMLLDVGPLGLDSRTASANLLARGRVASTPMHGWGSEHAEQYLRFVFSNEPLARLEQLRDRLMVGLRGV